MKIELEEDFGTEYTLEKILNHIRERYLLLLTPNGLNFPKYNITGLQIVKPKEYGVLLSLMDRTGDFAFAAFQSLEIINGLKDWQIGELLYFASSGEIECSLQQLNCDLLYFSHDFHYDICIIN